MFIRYSSTQKGFKCYDPSTRRAYVSRDVKFDEEIGLIDKKTWEILDDLTISKDSAATLRFILDGLTTMVIRNDYVVVNSSDTSYVQHDESYP
ncbi:hypothetical protein Bca4012_037846 [Brassica carinata]